MAERVAPLSFEQEALWLSEELVSGVSQYLMVLLFDLHGELDREALQHGVAHIAQRHEILRCALRRHDGVPSLILDERARVELTFVDLTSLPDGHLRELAARAIEDRWRGEPF